MKHNNKRVINVRPLFLVFIAFSAGIICIYNFLSAIAFKYFNLSLLIVPVILLFFLIATVFYLLQNKIHTKYLKLINFINNNYKYMIVFVLALIIGVGAGYIHTQQFARLKNYRNYQCEITGTIVEVDSNRLVLKDVMVKQDNARLSSGCVVYVYNEEDDRLNIGDVITIDGYLSLQPLYSNQVNVARFLSSNAYQFRMQTDGMQNVIKGKLTFAEKVRLNVFNTLSKKLNSDNVKVSMSILFGVRQDFPHEVNEAFSLVGISHLLSVSGLHVGILMMALSFVLKIISQKKSWWKFLAVFAIIAFYCYLCDFTYSVMRAAIMGLVLLASQQLGMRYDALSSISLAGIIILLIMPLAVFSVGFQLSFLCVFAIITIAPLLIKGLKKLKLPHNLASAIAIPISVNAVLFPLSANIFNKVSVISVFANIIIIPIFTFLFISLLGILVLILLLPFLSFLLFVPNIFLHTIKFIADVLSKMPFAYINIFNVGYFIVIITILVAFLIKFLMVKQSTKILISSAMVFVIVVVTVLSNTAVVSNTNKMCIDYQRNSNYAFVINDRSEVSLVGFDKNTYYINQSMISHRVKNIKNIIAYDFDLSMIPALTEFTSKNKVENIYFPSYFKKWQQLFKDLNKYSRYQFLDNEQHIDDFYIKEYNDFTNQPLALNLTVNDKQVLFVKKLKKAEFVYFANNLEEDVDYFISNAISYDYSNYFNQFNYVIYHNENNTKAQKSTDLYLNYSFTLHI